ncbi:MAG: 50S ribosomal protein L25/general stress protein Ctc [Xanthomonadales bacterium]|nr:50S ribosomal protein L25/general stress protein Ctc [Gammaproteobacteria bacterium]MBT8053351.1 50S ribosomal protein L25/general stress protein Ctc [Gammaproteobacteria bacterium]NND58063.1 50S ribosomal protein L25/general stress protein Ctc [Xanthomonadales bacterium]NNK52160.1 50S ribosomal protein L25/general stress protein Ctc [Xanthomonadales bacterium]
MTETTSIIAELREDVGKGASRRLRHEGKVPAVIYGGHRDPVALTVQQQELSHAAESESFFSSILEIKVGEDLTQQAVVRDMQRHPFKPVIMHIDFLRVSAEEVLRISVPIHFAGEDISPAGKTSGVIIQHQVTEVEISALPKDIPEFLSVDLSELDAGDAVMLSSIILPEGVSIPSLEMEGDDNDVPVANAVHIKESQGTGAAAAAEAEAAEAAGELGEIVEGEEAEEDADTEDEEESKDEGAE